MGPTAVADNEKNLYCFVNNIHVDYGEYTMEGFTIRIINPTSSIPESHVLQPPAPLPTFYKSRLDDLQDTIQEVEIAKEKEVEITQETEVEITQETLAVDITNGIIPVNVTDEDEEITDEVYELKRREKGKNVEETRNSPIPTPIRSRRIYTNLVSSDTEKLQELTDTPHTTSSSSSPHKKLTKTNRLLSLLKTKPTRFKRYKSFFHTKFYKTLWILFAHLRADKHDKSKLISKFLNKFRNQVPVTESVGNIQAQISTQIENAIANVIPSQVDATTPAFAQEIRTILQEDAQPKVRSSAKRTTTRNTSNTYASDDDEIPRSKVDPHRFEEHIKMDVERRSVKVKELQDKRILKAFKLSYQEKYEHVGPKSQDHEMARLQDDVKEVMFG
ncbi:hypothetical protein Tco_1509678 [Tanacetum coccineum]